MKGTTFEEHLAKVQEFEWHLNSVLQQAKKSALDRLKSEVNNDFEQIDGELYKIIECIERGRRIGEGVFIARRYKANGELVDYQSLVRMHYEPRDLDPDEGDYEEWELEQEFYQGMEEK